MAYTDCSPIVILELSCSEKLYIKKKKAISRQAAEAKGWASRPRKQSMAHRQTRRPKALTRVLMNFFSFFLFQLAEKLDHIYYIHRIHVVVLNFYLISLLHSLIFQYLIVYSALLGIYKEKE